MTPRHTRPPNPDNASKKKGKKIMRESSEPNKSLKIMIKQRQLDLTKITKEYEANQNVTLVESSILAKDVEKLAEGDKVSNEVFADSEIDNDEEDENDNDDHNDHAFIRTRKTGHSEDPIQELMEFNVPMIVNMRKTFVQKSNLREQLERVDNSLKEGVLKMMNSATNQLMKENLLWIVEDVVQKEKEHTKANIPSLVSQEFVAHAPQLIKELFRSYMQNIVLNNALKAKYEKSSFSTDSCRHDTFRKHDHDDHLDDDVLPEGKNRAKRSDPKEVLSDYKIVEVVRITTDKQYRLDFMEEIIVKRNDNKPYRFSEVDFKYMNKNNIKYMYYLCLNKKVNIRENRLLNSLLVFIRSYDIYERVHDYKLGAESYQIKFNLIAPTLTIHGIDELNPHSIIDVT
ncbi:hypothetical protein Tco_0423966, partial [Tanacetum coccineum]